MIYAAKVISLLSTLGAGYSLTILLLMLQKGVETPEQKEKFKDYMIAGIVFVFCIVLLQLNAQS